MHEIEWSARALRSLDTIGEFIAKDNPERAVSFTHEIFRTVDRLTRFPFLSRPGEKDDVRELVVHRNYLVSYRVRPARSEILQVWHTAQDRRAPR